MLSAIKNWKGAFSSDDIQVAEIDPAYMGGKELSAHYNVTPGANCVVVEIVRGDQRNLAACLVPVGEERADLNGKVKKCMKLSEFLLLHLRRC